MAHRYQKYRKLGTYRLLPTAEERGAAVALAKEKAGPSRRPPKVDTSPSLLAVHLAEETVTGSMSRYRGLAPAGCPSVPPTVPPNKVPVPPRPAGWTNAKKVLDASGPEALAKWVVAQQRVLLTDTTMRDAHQSLLATRVRTEDLVKGAVAANECLKDAFSFEAWGGATFDVCMRFQDECPWEVLLYFHTYHLHLRHTRRSEPSHI